MSERAQDDPQSGGDPDLFAFRYEGFSLQDYDPHPHIKAEVAV